MGQDKLLPDSTENDLSVDDLDQLEAEWTMATPEERLEVMKLAYGPNMKLKDLDTGEYLTRDQSLKKLAAMKFSELINGIPVPRGGTQH